MKYKALDIGKYVFELRIVIHLEIVGRGGMGYVCAMCVFVYICVYQHRFVPFSLLFIFYFFMW